MKLKPESGLGPDIGLNLFLFYFPPAGHHFSLTTAVCRGLAQTRLQSRRRVTPSCHTQTHARARSSTHVAFLQPAAAAQATVIHSSLEMETSSRSASLRPELSFPASPPNFGPSSPPSSFVSYARFLRLRFAASVIIYRKTAWVSSCGDDATGDSGKKPDRTFRC